MRVAGRFRMSAPAKGAVAVPLCGMRVRVTQQTGSRRSAPRRLPLPPALREGEGRGEVAPVPAFLPTGRSAGPIPRAVVPCRRGATFARFARFVVQFGVSRHHISRSDRLLWGNQLLAGLGSQFPLNSHWACRKRISKALPEFVVIGGIRVRTPCPVTRHTDQVAIFRYVRLSKKQNVQVKPSSQRQPKNATHWLPATYSLRALESLKDIFRYFPIKK